MHPDENNQPKEDIAKQVLNLTLAKAKEKAQATGLAASAPTSSASSSSSSSSSSAPAPAPAAVSSAAAASSASAAPVARHASGRPRLNLKPLTAEQRATAADNISSAAAYAAKSLADRKAAFAPHLARYIKAVQNVQVLDSAKKNHEGYSEARILHIISDTNSEKVKFGRGDRDDATLFLIELGGDTIVGRIEPDDSKLVVFHAGPSGGSQFTPYTKKS